MNEPRPSEAPARPFRRVGHKGAAALVTGNTVASFERGVELGADTVELDVLWLRDGHPSRPGSARPSSIAHDWEDAASRPLLTLDEALDAFTRPPLDRVELDLDIKLVGREGEIAEAVALRGLTERAMVSTMNTESLAAIRAIEPGLRLGWTYPLVTRAYDRSRLMRPLVAAAIAAMRARFPAELRERAPRIGASAVWLFHQLATPQIVDAARDAGVELICWTVDDAAQIKRLREMGVDGIVSNDPRLLA